MYNILKSIEYVLLRHDDLGVIAADIVSYLFSVFKVDGVGGHTYRKGAYGLCGAFCGYGANERRIKSARKQEAYLCICHESFLYALYKLLTDITADRLKTVMTYLIDFCDVVIAYEFSALVIMSGREGHDLIADAGQVFGLAGKYDISALCIAVIQRTYAYGVTGSDELFFLAVEDNAGKLRIESGKHIRSVLSVKWQYYLAVGIAPEIIAFVYKHSLCFFKSVKLSVADGIAAVQLEGLHTLGVKSHYGKSVEAQQALAEINDLRTVGAS